VSNIGSSGQDGVEVGVGDSFFHLDVALPDSVPIGSTVTMTSLGALSSSPGSTQVVESIEIVQCPDGQLVTPDVNPQGASTYTMKLFLDDGTLVAEATGMSGSAGKANAQTLKLKKCRHDGKTTYHWKGSGGGSATFDYVGPAAGSARGGGDTTTVVADYLCVIPESPTDPIVAFGAERVTAADVAEFTIEGEWAVPGFPSPLPIAALGQADLSGTDRTRVVGSGLDSSGTDGLLADFIDFIVAEPAVEGFEIDVEDVDPTGSLPDSAWLDVTVVGAVGGGSDTDAGTLRIQRVGSALEIVPAFGGVSATEATVEVWNLGAPVASVGDRSGVVATVAADRWPTGVHGRAGDLNIIVIWPTGVAVTVPGAGALMGDELRIRAEDGVPVHTLDSVAMQTAGIESLVVIGGKVLEEGTVTPASEPTVAVSVAGLFVAPNPFATGTVVRFRLSEPARVTLNVYDVAGRRVRRVLAPRWLGTGGHETVWDGRDDRGRRVPSGVYYLRLGGTGEATGARQVVRLR
jgi:hypothetical protein